MIYWTNKRVAARLDYGHDFGPEIGDADDPLVEGSLLATVQAGDVTLSTPVLAPDNDQEILVIVSGGTHQSLNRIRLYGETVAGRKVEQVAILRVRDQ